MALQDPNIMPSSCLGCQLSLKTPNMGNTGLKPRLLSQFFGYIIVQCQRGSHGGVIVRNVFDVKMLVSRCSCETSDHRRINISVNNRNSTPELHRSLHMRIMAATPSRVAETGMSR